MANLQVGVAGNGTVTVGAGASVHSPASNTLTLGTNNAEKLRIISGGNVLIGTTDSDPVSNGEVPKLIIKGIDSTAGIAIVRHSANASGSGIYIGKSRNATPGSNTILQDDDETGRITFSGDDGTDVNSETASIISYVDGTPGANDMPGRLVFKTTADGANMPTERLRIDSLGRLLVGTTAHWGSDVKLHLANATNTYLVLTSGTSHNGVLAFSDDGSERGAIDYDHNGDHMLFKTAAGERLRIDSAGSLLFNQTQSKILVNTSDGSDSKYLSLNGGGDASQSRGAGITLYGNEVSGSEGNLSILAGNSGSANGIIQMYTGGSERFRITSGGLFHFGHSSNNAGSNGRLYVMSGTGQCTADLHHSTNDSQNVLNVIHGGVGVGGNPTRVMVEWRNFNNASVAQITSNSSTVSYGTGSDYRMKENQVDISDGITRVKQLKPYRFNWKSEYGGGDKVDGFFAHEAATVVPEAVKGTKDAVDSNGDIIRQQIDQAKLVPVLTAALKEAIAKIEVLETKVAALESA